MITQANLMNCQKDRCNHHRNIQIFSVNVLKMKKDVTSPLMESRLNQIINSYNVGTIQ